MASFELCPAPNTISTVGFLFVTSSSSSMMTSPSDRCASRQDWIQNKSKYFNSFKHPIIDEEEHKEQEEQKEEVAQERDDDDNNNNNNDNEAAAVRYTCYSLFTLTKARSPLMGRASFC